MALVDLLSHNEEAIVMKLKISGLNLKLKHLVVVVVCRAFESSYDDHPIVSTRVLLVFQVFP